MSVETWGSVAEFSHSFTNYLLAQKTPIKGISLLKHAIIRLKYFAENQLTSIHADLCQLCLVAKCFKPALQILDADIISICQEVSKLCYQKKRQCRYFTVIVSTEIISNIHYSKLIREFATRNLYHSIFFSGRKLSKLIQMILKSNHE